MTGKENLKRDIKDLKRAMKEAAKGAETGGATGRRVNIAQRANIVVSDNVGEGESSHGAAARQTVRIRQDGGDTEETTERAETHA